MNYEQVFSILYKTLAITGVLILLQMVWKLVAISLAIVLTMVYGPAIETTVKQWLTLRAFRKAGINIDAEELRKAAQS